MIEGLRPLLYPNGRPRLYLSVAWKELEVGSSDGFKHLVHPAVGTEPVTVSIFNLDLLREIYENARLSRRQTGAPVTKSPSQKQLPDQRHWAAIVSAVDSQVRLSALIVIAIVACVALVEVLVWRLDGMNLTLLISFPLIAMIFLFVFGLLSARRPNPPSSPQLSIEKSADLISAGNSKARWLAGYWTARLDLVGAPGVVLNCWLMLYVTPTNSLTGWVAYEGAKDGRARIMASISLRITPKEN